MYQSAATEAFAIERESIAFWRLGILLCVLLLAPLSEARSGGRTMFMRVTDPGQPFHDLQPLLESECDSEFAIDTASGPVKVRYPQLCERSMQPVHDLMLQGFDLFASRVKPLPSRFETLVYIADGRNLPGNIRLRSDRPNVWVVLLPEGCEEPGWHRNPLVWDTLMRTLFHESFHHVAANRFPKGTPLWVEEGAAEYVAHYVSTSLDPDGEENLAALERFIVEPESSIESVFRWSGSWKKAVRQGMEAFHRYALYLGAFLAAERLAPGFFDDLLDRLTRTDEPQRGSLVPSVLELHREAQNLREPLIEEALQNLGEEGDWNEEALVRLGRFGHCPDHPEAVVIAGVTCSDQTARLAPYLGECLGQTELKAFLRTIRPCADRLHPDWLQLVEIYARRFPEEAPELLVDFLELDQRMFTTQIHKILVRTTGKKIRFDANASAEKRSKSIERWRRWLGRQQR